MRTSLYSAGAYILSGALLVSTLSQPVLFAKQQANSVPRNQIIEKLACLNNPLQSYALYLPSNYTSDRKWPILYAFDPGGRGKSPLERFKDAAEQFGWIIAGSNNSRNGPWRNSLEAWDAMSGDTHQRFSIDDQRIYATGLSGGARVALGIAQLCRDCIAGVIACSAGFPVGVAPSSQMHFLFFGTTGVDDFNFPELKNLGVPLTKAAIAHRIAVFDGRHEWPPVSVAADAVEWMELQAMKAGKRGRDDALINNSWVRTLTLAQTLEASAKLSEACETYLHLSETFRGLRDASEVERKATELSNRNEVKAALREEQQQIKRQGEFEAQLQSFISAQRERNGDSAAGRNRPSGSINDDEGMAQESQARSLITKLQRQARANEDSGTRRVARRTLDGVFVSLFEQGSSQLQSEKHYGQAIDTFKLATEINPDRSSVFFYLAWAYAASGDRKRSLQALSVAIDKGFSDRAAISNIQVFDAFRTDPQFQQILDRLKPK